MISMVELKELLAMIDSVVNDKNIDLELANRLMELAQVTLESYEEEKQKTGRGFLSCSFSYIVAVLESTGKADEAFIHVIEHSNKSSRGGYVHCFLDRGILPNFTADQVKRFPEATKDILDSIEHAKQYDNKTVENFDTAPWYALLPTQA